MTTMRDTFEAEANRELAERVARLRKVVDEGLEALSSPLSVKISAEEPQSAETALTPVQRFLDVACSAGSQKEILGALLDASAACFSRTVLFILRSGALVAWEARNTERAQGAGVEGVAHLTIPASGDHLPARALASGSMVTAGSTGPGFLLTEALGGSVPARSAAVPLVVRGRPVAILYGDCGSRSSSNGEPVFAMLGPIGSLGIEALGSVRRGRSATAHRGGVDRVGGRQATDGERVPGAQSARNPFSDDRTHAGYGLESEDVPSQVAATDAPVSPTAPEEAEMQALLGDIEGMRRNTSDGRLSPEEQRVQADARRFASLLISEILLYNEEAVILGRRNHDLSKRLAREIDKSRQAFATRIPGHLGGAGRYFDEELIRVLAEGDSSVLGN